MHAPLLMVGVLLVGSSCRLLVVFSEIGRSGKLVDCDLHGWLFACRGLVFGDRCPDRNRPGRNKAGSNKSGRFVAPITNTPLSPGVSLIPSNSARSCETILSITPALSAWFPRLGATESSSSKNTTHGRASRALWKTLRTFASDSPIYIFNSSGPLTEKKFNENDVATAFASNVFPVPGGP